MVNVFNRVNVATRQVPGKHPRLGVSGHGDDGKTYSLHELTLIKVK